MSDGFHDGLLCPVFDIISPRLLGLSTGGCRFGVVVNALVSINEVNLRRTRLVLGWVTESGVQLQVREKLSQYITSHPGQLRLAIPPWVGAIDRVPPGPAGGAHSAPQGRSWIEQGPGQVCREKGNGIWEGRREGRECGKVEGKKGGTGEGGHRRGLEDIPAVYTPNPKAWISRSKCQKVKVVRST